MDVVRRNTDYAARLIIYLANHYGSGPISTREAAGEEHVPYQLACKLMQKLNRAKLVESCMGPRGGFALAKEPSKINMLEVVKAIQGPISINRCVMTGDDCSRRRTCPVRSKLADLQKNMDKGLTEITFDKLLRNSQNINNRNTKGKSNDRKR